MLKELPSLCLVSAALLTLLQDPLIHAKLLVVGRQCLNDTLYKFDVANAKIADKINNTRSRT